MSRHRLIISALALVIAGGLFLRLYELNREGLWLDEGGSVMKTEAGLKEFIKGVQPYISPPLYYLCLGGWVKVFGDTEVSVRFPSLIFGTISIFFLYLIGKTIYDELTGLIASFIFSLSPFAIYFSQEARMYSLLLFLSLVSMYYFIKLVGEKNTLKQNGNRQRIFYIIYIISSILLLYTHNLGISPLIAQNIFVLILFLKTGRLGGIRLKNWIILQLILLLAFLPWITVVIEQLIGIQGNYWSPPVSLRTLGDTLLDYSGSCWLLIFFSSFVAISIMFSFIGRRKENFLISSTSFRRDLFPYRILFLFIWLSIPCLLPFVISLVSTPIYISRIAISASAAFYLLAAAGIGGISKKKPVIILITIFGLLSAPTLWRYYHITHKEPLREVISEIEDEVQPGDIILIMPLWYKKFILDYYHTKTNIPTRGFSQGIIGDKELQELAEIITEYKGIWIILCQGKDISAILKDEFPEGFSQAKNRSFDYFNYQAKKEMTIKVYKISGGGK